MKRLFAAFALVCLVASLAARAQDIVANPSNPRGGNLTAASTNCSVQGSCVWMKLPANVAAVGVTVSGTWSATVLVEESSDGVNFTTLATLSSNTIVSYTVLGMTDVRLRVSAFTSGTVNVNIQASTQAGAIAGGFANPASLNNLQFASQYAGADWCAKVTAADTALGAASGEIWVDSSAGSSACAAAPALSNGHVLRFIQGGTYSIGVGWTITNKNNWGIAGLPGKLTTIQFTGTAGFTAIGTGLTNLSYGDKITDVTFSGNSGITNAVTLQGITRSVFDFSARNSSGVAVVCQACLLDTGRIVVSSNEGTFTSTPTGGVLLDQVTSPSTITSNDNDIFYVIEGVAGPGIEIAHGSANILRGTSEGNTGASGRGVQIDAGGNATMMIGYDMESNNVEDVLMNGTNLLIMESVCTSSVRVHVGSTGTNVFNLGPGNGTSACTPTTIDTGGAGYVGFDPLSMNNTKGNVVNTFGNQLVTPTQIIAGGTKPTLSGTGACSTITSQVGGTWNGTFQCTGTSGSATITMTFPSSGQNVAAFNAYNCFGRDLTTTTDTLVQTTTTLTTTGCSLSSSALVSGDVIAFSAFGY